MDADALRVDFDVYATQKAALLRHIDACRTQHENACQSLDRLVRDHMTALPSIHQPLLEIVSLMRERHNETHQFLVDVWLREVDAFVGASDEVHTEAVARLSEE